MADKGKGKDNGGTNAGNGNGNGNGGGNNNNHNAGNGNGNGNNGGGNNNGNNNGGGNGGGMQRGDGPFWGNGAAAGSGGGGNGNGNNNQNNNNNHNGNNGGGGTNANASGGNHNSGGIGSGGVAAGGGGNGGGNGNAGNGNQGNNNHNGNNGGGGGNGGTEAGTGPLHAATAVGGGNGNGGTNAGGNHNGGNSGNGSGGTTAPLPTSSWTDNYQQWLKEHPNPGHSPGAKSTQYPGGIQQWNSDYHAWLQQHPNPGNNVNNGGNHNNGGNGGTTAPAGAGNPNPTGANNGVFFTPRGTFPGGNGDDTSATPAVPGAVSTTGVNDPSNPASSVFNGSDSTGGTNVNFPSATFSPGNNNDPLIPGGSDNTDTGIGNLSFIPGSDSTASPVTGAYVVQEGDSLANIAEMRGMSLSQLEALNPQITHPNLIYPGQAINVSSGGDPSPQSAVGYGTAPAGGFPTTSTYPPVDDSNKETEMQVAGKLQSLKNRFKGWGTSSTPSDPAQKSMYLSDNRNTNPLDIKDKGHGPHNNA